MAGKKGCTGTYVRSEETKAKMRAIAAARPASYYAKFVASAHTPEAHAKGAAKRAGQKRSYEFREACRQRMLDHLASGGKPLHEGHSHDFETVCQISRNRKGKTAKENNPNWQGGKAAERSARLADMHTQEYRDWRRRVFDRDNYTCVDCGSKGVPIQADHILWYSDHPELRYEVSNGRTLCVPCHKIRTREGHQNRKRG